MKLTLTEFLALAITASAVPAIKPTSTKASKQCGTQNPACYSDISISNSGGDESSGGLLAPRLDPTDYVTQTIAIPTLPVTTEGAYYRRCYKNTGKICPGIAACCPGGGGQCNVIAGGGAYGGHYK